MISDSDLKSIVKIIPEEIVELKKEAPDLSWIDCTIEICERYNIELESSKSVLPKHIKLKIEAEASELLMLKPEHRTKTVIM